MHTSMIVKPHDRDRSASFICALWTRPRMLAVPIPCAIPENRVSKRGMRLKINESKL